MVCNQATFSEPGKPSMASQRRNGPSLQGILVTYVDDIKGGMSQEVWDQAFSRSKQAIEFATNHVKDFIFRGREVTPEGHIDISMRNYALSMKGIKIDKERRQHLEDDLRKLS